LDRARRRFLFDLIAGDERLAGGAGGRGGELGGRLRQHPNRNGTDQLRQLLWAIVVCAQSSQRATWPPSAAVRQRSIAVITFIWSRLT